MIWDDFSGLDTSNELSAKLTPREIAVLLSIVAIAENPGRWDDYETSQDEIQAELADIIHRLIVAV